MSGSYDDSVGVEVSSDSFWEVICMFYQYICWEGVCVFTIVENKILLYVKIWRELQDAFGYCGLKK